MTISNEVQKIIDKRTIPKYLFPELIKRHLSQPRTHINYYKQIHEQYVYTFFYNTPFVYTKTIKINGIEGIYKSAIKCEDITLKDKIVEDDYFGILKYVPVPFIFIPLGDLKLIRSICTGGYNFENGILMDLEFASNVGIDFIGGEILCEKKIALYYIGMIYDPTFE